MDLPDIEPNDPLNPESIKLGPADCQSISRQGVIDSLNRTTIEIHKDDLELLDFQNIVSGAIQATVDQYQTHPEITEVITNSPEVPTPDVPKPKVGDPAAIVIAEKLAEKLGFSGAFHFVTTLSKEIADRISKNKEIVTKTFAGKVGEMAVDATAIQFGIEKIKDAIKDYHARTTSHLHTPTHMVYLGGKVASAVAGNVPLVGNELAKRLEILVNHLIKKMRSQKASKN